VLIFDNWVEEEQIEVLPEPIQIGDVVPWIGDIDRQGKATIFFSEKINPWSNSTLEKYSQEENKNALLALKVIQAPESDISADNLIFTWEIVNVTDEYMEIKLKFKATEYVSAATTDKLSVVFLRGSEFSTGNTTVSDMKEIRKKLKKQLSLSATVEIFLDVSEVTGTASKATAIGAWVLTLFMSTSFQLLWSLVNTFQMIVHLPLINVNTPVNALSLLEEISAMANMDVIPTGDLMELMFDFTKPWEATDPAVDEQTSAQVDARVLAETDTEIATETEMQSSSEVEEADEATMLEIPERFQAIGYDSINFIENLGFLFVFILIFAVILVVLASLWLLSCCWDRAYPYYKSLYKSIFWNMQLTFGLEGYIEFAVGSFINLHLLYWVTISDIFNSVACIVGLTLTVLLPPFVLWYLV